MRQREKFIVARMQHEASIRGRVIPTLYSQDVSNDELTSLREVATLQSITDGQGMLKCYCKGGCETNENLM
jgi:hypothetical protein